MVVAGREGIGWGLLFGVGREGRWGHGGGCGGRCGGDCGGGGGMKTMAHGKEDEEDGILLFLVKT